MVKKVWNFELEQTNFTYFVKTSATNPRAADQRTGSFIRSGKAKKLIVDNNDINCRERLWFTASKKVFFRAAKQLQQSGKLSLSQSCALYGISRQAFYKREKSLKEESDKIHSVKDFVLQKRIHMPRIGTRKLYRLLDNDFKKYNLKIGRDKLFSYLKHLHMLIKPLKSYTKTTNSKHWLHKYPNLLKSFKPQRAEEVWVSDITYFNTLEKTCYISLVTDAYSRKIMGYHLSEDLRTEHMVKALKMAIGNKKSSNKTIHHSDRGLQYCSEQYQTILNHNNIKCSMTDGYDCYQNALAERMNGILKMEFLIGKYPDFYTLQKSLDQSIETYNNKRPHLSLNYKTPNEVHKKSLISVDQGHLN